jgi:hypothetical protein
MAECPVCNGIGEYICPICKRRYCEKHLTNHKCKPKRLPKVQNYSNVVIIPLTIFVLLVAFLLFRGIQTGEFTPKAKQTAVTEPEPIEIPKEYETQYMDIKFDYNETHYDNEMFFYGFLRKQKIGIGYINYLVDDYDNRISLSFNNPDSKDVFDNSRHDQLYKLTGILKERHLGQVIHVNSIEETKRPIVEVEI